MSEDFEHEHIIKAEKKNDKPIEMFETIYIDVDIDPNRINKNKKVAFSDLLEDVRFIKKKKKGYLSNPFKKVQKLMTRSSSLGSVYICHYKNHVSRFFENMYAKECRIYFVKYT